MVPIRVFNMASVASFAASPRFAHHASSIWPRTSGSGSIRSRANTNRMLCPFGARCVTANLQPEPKIATAEAA